MWTATYIGKDPLERTFSLQHVFQMKNKLYILIATYYEILYDGFHAFVFSFEKEFRIPKLALKQ